MKAEWNKDANERMKQTCAHKEETTKFCLWNFTFLAQNN